MATVSHASEGRTQGWCHMRGPVLGRWEGIKFARPRRPARRKCRPASEARDTGAPGRESVLEGGASRTRAQAHCSIPRFMPKCSAPCAADPSPGAMSWAGPLAGRPKNARPSGGARSSPRVFALLGDSPPDEVRTQTLHGMGGVGSAPATLRCSREFPPPEVLAGAGLMGVMSLPT